jgi:hypothetical protein
LAEAMSGPAMAPFELKRLAQDGFCIDDTDVSKLAKLRYEKMSVVTDAGVCVRKLVLVAFPAKFKDDDRQKLYWADRTTGTLYRMDGTCCSTSRHWIEGAA